MPFARFLALLLFLSITLWAEYISDFTVDVKVEQSGSLQVTEKIIYDFETATKHGIFRTIPYTVKVNGIIKEIGIENFSVLADGKPEKWEKSEFRSKNTGPTLKIKIGRSDRLLTGKHTYLISYRVKMGVLPAADREDYDAIRWNAIGTGWPVTISKATARFHLPPSLSQSDIIVVSYTGSYGEKGSWAATRWLDPHQLEVTIDTLYPGEGMTVELAYPEGMLDQSGKENLKPSLYDTLLGLWHWFALGGFVLYFRRVLKRHTGFVDKRSIAVQYEPPKGLSLLQSGLILDKHTDDRDFAAAILELAQMGYIEIDDPATGGNTVLKRTQKETKGLTINQKYLLDNVLFDNGNIFIMKKRDRTTAQKLRDGFDHINDNLYTWSVAEGYMEENPKKARLTFLFKSILYLLPVAALAFYTYYRQMGDDAVFALFFPLIFGMAGLLIFVTERSIGKKIMGTAFVGAGVIPFIGVTKQHGIDPLCFLLGPAGALILILGMLYYVYRNIGRFTQKGAYANKQLLGLKEFVSRVKEDEIKRRLAMDPDYLDKLLPYAMLFGVTEHWLHFYDVLKVPTPYWYHGNLHQMGSFDSQMQSSATSPASGSSGGGGFSGGGGGGGGGGSW